MSNETILVSAYMSDVFNVPGLDASQYIKYAEPLLMLPKKKIIFIDSTIFYKVYNTPKHSSTVLIPFDKKTRGMMARNIRCYFTKSKE